MSRANRSGSPDRTTATLTWHRVGARGRVRAPDGLLGRWLLDTRSLTDRVRACCRDTFSVRVVAQGWDVPRRDEVTALALPGRERALVREVQLLCGARPWVFARTVIPARTLTGPQRRLARLGTKPLGAFLFADPGMRRGPVELACLRPGAGLYRAAVAGLARKPSELWGRRSLFWLGGKPLLVCEVFLPALAPCDTGSVTIRA